MADRVRRPTLTQADYERLAAFRYTLRRFTTFSAEAAHAEGLTTHQHQALLAIKGHTDGMITIGQLAEQLIVAPHTAAELASRLVCAGMVDKTEDKTDRRRVGLVLTIRAEKALRELTLVHLHELQILTPKLMRILNTFDRKIDEFSGSDNHRTAGTNSSL